MKISKKVKMRFTVAGGVIVLLFTVLIVHIVIMVKNKNPIANSTIQLARADFKQPVDSASATIITRKIDHLPGVKSSYFNLKDGILIYAFDNRENTGQNIYAHAVENSGFKSNRYIINKGDLTMGCPVIDNQSFYGKITNVIEKIVN